MILENVFLAEVKLDNGDVDEFVEKCWYALKMHIEYPEEEIGNNAFCDWARDLDWLEFNTIVILVRGKVQADARRTIEMINRYWESNETKKVHFILVD